MGYKLLQDVSKLYLENPSILYSSNKISIVIQITDQFAAYVTGWPGKLDLSISRLWRCGPSEKPVLCHACGSRWRIRGSLVDYIPKHAIKDYQSKRSNYGAQVTEPDYSSVCFEDGTANRSSLGSTATANRSSLGSTASSETIIQTQTPTSSILK